MVAANDDFLLMLGQMVRVDFQWKVDRIFSFQERTVH